MINYIFGGFIIVGIIYSFMTGNVDLVNDTLITSGDAAIEMIIKLIPLMCLWMGVMKIAEVSGFFKVVSGKISKIICFLFPDLNKDSDAIFYIASNITMNMLGVGNAATPFGLKAMDELQKCNNKKEVATRSMITFLVINTASVTIIPTTVISLRKLNGSINASEILVASIIVTFLSCFFGIIMDRIFYYLWRKYD